MPTPHLITEILSVLGMPAQEAFGIAELAESCEGL